VIHTLSDAKFHGKANGVYFKAICKSKCSRVMNHYKEVYKGFVCFFTES